MKQKYLVLSKVDQNIMRVEGRPYEITMPWFEVFDGLQEAAEHAAVVDGHIIPTVPYEVVVRAEEEK